MNIVLLRALMISLILVLAGCGGGGSNDNDDDYSGLDSEYQFQYVLYPHGPSGSISLPGHTGRVGHDV